MKYPLSKLARRWAGQHWPAVGVLCAGFLLVEVNVLSARHYTRFDASAGQLYTLSAPTRALLETLTQPVKLTVLLGSQEPLQQELRHLLTAYRAISHHLDVEYVDPDRDLAKFLALQSAHDLGVESLPEGGTFADTAVIVSGPSRHHYIRTNQLAAFDDEGRVRLHLEARLSEGLAQVLDARKLSVCFITGHGERSVDDTAPEGLLELRRILTRSNITPERVPLDVPDPEAALASCDNIAIVGPSRPFPSEHTQALSSRFRSGVNFALFLDPIVDPEGHIAASGLAPLLSTLGVEEHPSFVIEGSPSHRLPTGIGEIFFAEPKTHPLTEGLSSESARTDARVVAAFAQPFFRSPKSTISPIFETSPRAYAQGDLKGSGGPQRTEGALTLAFAGSIPLASGQTQKWVVMGTSNVLENTSFRDPALFGNRTFAENSFAWLLKKPQIVSVPDRPPLQAGLNLTEESLSALLRYVLIYMPLTAASAGALVLYRRRRTADSSHPGGKEQTT